MSALVSLQQAVVALSPSRRLSPIDLRVEAGELIALLGRNGAGKTSLLRAAAGITPLVRGEITVDGMTLSGRIDRNALARKLAYLPQGESSAETELSVRELLELGRAPYLGFLGRLGPDDRRAIDAAAAATELEGLLDRRLDTLSAGERQRAHLGRCLAQDTAVLMLDEPTSSLDPEHAMELLGKVRARVADGRRAALIVLHDLVLAARFADRVAILGDDRVVAFGPPEEVLTRQVLAEAMGIDAVVTREGDEVVLRIR